MDEVLVWKELAHIGEIRHSARSKAGLFRVAEGSPCAWVRSKRQGVLRGQLVGSSAPLARLPAEPVRMRGLLLAPPIGAQGEKDESGVTCTRARSHSMQWLHLRWLNCAC